MIALVKRKIKPSKNLFITLVFFGLLATAYFLRNPGLIDKINRKEALIFPGFDGEKINKLVIGRFGEFGEVLVKKDGKWIVESEDGFPADKEKIEEVLTAAEEMDSVEIVAVNKESHEKFGLDKFAVTVKMFESEGGKEYELVLGKNGPGMVSSYFRKGGEDSVYVYGGLIRAYYEPDEWRDLKIRLRNSDSGFKKLVVKNRNGEFGLEKKGEKWAMDKIKSDSSIDQSKVEGLIDKLNNIYAAGASASATIKKAGLEDPYIKVVVEGEKGEDEIIIGDEEAQGRRYAQVKGSPYIYIFFPSGYEIFEDVDGEYFVEEEEDL